MQHVNEHHLQVACVSWLRAQHPYLTPIFYSVPNGGYRSKATAGKMQAEGQQPGISDLCLDLPSGKWHGLRIEMKTDKGQQSDYQIAYENYCRITGYKYCVCRSLEEFQQIITEWLQQVDGNVMAAIRELHSVNEAAASMKQASVVRRASSRRVAVRSNADVHGARKEMESILGHGMGEIRNKSLRGILNMS